MVTLIFMLVVAKSSLAFTPPLLVEIATCSTLLIPFVLPKMHQRYFFPADILSIVFGFYFPAYAYVPIVINLVSFFSYQYFLFGAETFPMSQLSLAAAATRRAPCGACGLSKRHLFNHGGARPRLRRRRHRPQPRRRGRGAARQRPALGGRLPRSSVPGAARPRRASPAR